jgi:hypothetical protein
VIERAGVDEHARLAELLAAHRVAAAATDTAFPASLARRMAALSSSTLRGFTIASTRVALSCECTSSTIHAAPGNSASAPDETLRKSRRFISGNARTERKAAQALAPTRVGAAIIPFVNGFVAR